MAGYSTSVPGWTTTAIAINTQATANNYHAIGTRSSTDTAKITEIYVGGESTSSTVVRMRYQRYSTHATTATDQTPEKLNPYSAASVTKFYQTASGTQPTFANTPPTLNIAFNSFGGIVRWVAYPGEEIWHSTATAPNDEGALASLSGAGTVSSNIVFEQV